MRSRNHESEDETVSPASVRTAFEDHQWFPVQIASLLSLSQALNFASTCWHCRVLRLRNITGADTWETRAIWNGDYNEYKAKRWQYLPLFSDINPVGTDPELSPLAPVLSRLPSYEGEENLCGGAHTVFVTMNWCDQGWGNRKGMISIVNEDASGGLGDDGQELPARAPGDYQAWPPCVVAGKDPAPHNRDPLRLTFHPIKGKTYSIWYRVGGGGGHRLEVSECTVRVLEFCSPIIPMTDTTL